MPLFPSVEEIRKKQIIETTLLIISAKGASNITMRDIARAAGLSNGGLAHYYPSKESLFKAVFKDFFQQIFKRSREELDLIDDPIEKLLGFGAFFDINEPDVQTGYPILFDCISIAVHNREYQELFDEWLESWATLLRDTIEQGIKKKLFINIDADAAARTVSSIYLGISIRWYLTRESNSTEWAIKAFKESILSLMEPYRVK